jgi:hypothetical protein
LENLDEIKLICQNISKSISKKKWRLAVFLLSLYVCEKLLEKLKWF